MTGSSHERPPNPVAARIARLIAFVALVGAGASAFMTFIGRSALGLKLCAGSFGLGVVILLIGGVVVAASRP